MTEPFLKFLVYNMKPLNINFKNTNIMGNCDCDKKKRSYHFNVTEVEDGKIKEAYNFNFGGHHDLVELINKTVALGNITEKHAKQLVTGVRLLHHVLKKYPDNELFKNFQPQLKAFKHALKEEIKGKE